MSEVEYEAMRGEVYILHSVKTWTNAEQLFSKCTLVYSEAFTDIDRADILTIAKRAANADDENSPCYTGMVTDKRIAELMGDRTALTFNWDSLASNRNRGIWFNSEGSTKPRVLLIYSSSPGLI